MALPCTPVIPGEVLLETIFKGDGDAVIDLPGYYHDTEGVVITRWRLTQDEIEIFRRAGDIYLWQWTHDRPLQPMAITVENPCKELETENTIIEETDKSRYDISRYGSYDEVASDEQLTKEFQAALTKLQRGFPVTLTISPLEAWLLFSTLQLALRHPQNNGPTAKTARQLAMQIQKAIATKGVLKLFAEMGWHEQFDYIENLEGVEQK